MKIFELVVTTTLKIKADDIKTAKKAAKEWNGQLSITSLGKNNYFLEKLKKNKRIISYCEKDK